MPDRIPRIVAGVSELSADDPTLLVATELARAAGAELYLVHAYQLARLVSMAPGMEMSFPEGTPQYAEDLLALLEAAARRLPGGEKAICRVVPGPPAAELAALAAEVHADLIVVGAARGSRLSRTMLGTTAQRVLRAAGVPVLVARRPLLLPLTRVLLTSDLSPLSAAVHRIAVATVTRFFRAPERFRSLLVMGWSPAPAPLTPEIVGRAARDALASFLRERGAATPPVEAAVRTGILADEIVAEARDWAADLLVVGTHARGWSARMMLGSVAEAALRDAPCNVLAVPPLRSEAPAAATPDPVEWPASPELERWLQSAS